MCNRYADPPDSLNLLTAFTLLHKLRPRMVAHDEGTHDGSIDLLITGCEVSLWVGEEFQSDLHNAFPQLRWYRVRLSIPHSRFHRPTV